VEPEILELLQRLLKRLDAENPADVMPRHGQRGLETRVDALLPGRVIIPDRAPGDARLEARLHGSAARRIIAAKADRHDADAIRIDIRTRRQIVEAGAAGDFIVVAHRHAAEA